MLLSCPSQLIRCALSMKVCSRSVPGWAGTNPEPCSTSPTATHLTGGSSAAVASHIISPVSILLVVEATPALLVVVLPPLPTPIHTTPCHKFPSSHLFSLAQAQGVHQPAPYALDEKHVTCSNARPTFSGMGPRPGVGRTTKEGLFPRWVKSSASTGTLGVDALPRVMKTDANVPAAGTRITALRSVLELRKNQALTPYNAKAWKLMLVEGGLLDKYPNLPISLAHGFDEESTTLTHLTTAPPSTSCRSASKLSTKNSNVDATSAHALRTKWKLLLGLSNYPPYLWFPNQANLVASVLCTTFCIPMFLPPTPSLLITLLMLIYTPAHGAPLPPYVTLFTTCLQALRHPSEMWQKPIVPFPSSIANGQVLWSSYGKTIHLLSTPAITLGLLQPVEFLVDWVTQWPTFFGHMELGHCLSGSMTTYSSKYNMSSFLLTTPNEKSGTELLNKTRAEPSQVVGIGIMVRWCQTISQQNLMKMLLIPYKTLPQPLLVRLKTLLTHTVIMILISSQKDLESLGSLQKPFCSATLSLIWASTGISHQRPSLSQQPRKKNTRWPSRNGFQGQFTPWMRFRSFMASFSTCPSSSQPDVLISPTWKPCLAHLPPTLLCYTTHLEAQPKTLDGGSIPSVTPSSLGIF